MNVLHMASQGDQALSMVTFISKGVNPNTYDCKGSTALQWACYLGSRTCVDFLLRETTLDLDNTDKNNRMTALHLAVAGNHYSIVKRLLHR